MAEETFTDAAYSLMALKEGQPNHTCTVLHFEQPLTGMEIEARAMDYCLVVYQIEDGWSGHSVVIVPF